VNSCVHSLLKCGECKREELPPINDGALDVMMHSTGGRALPTIAELEAKIAQFHKELEAAKVAQPVVKLDLGCGTMKKEGFIGVDSRAFPGVDVVCNLGRDVWPWPDSSVDEVSCQQMLEHIPGKDLDFKLEVDWERTHTLTKVITYPRVHFFNELWRVLKPGGKGDFSTPHWCSPRAYGDPTHEWPPVCEWTWCYLDKEWRATQAPHDDMFKCDFICGYGYSLAPWLQEEIASRNQEFVQKHTTEALRKYKEAAGDIIATLTARK
jgi:SAM-dependent methyltransferase